MMIALAGYLTNYRGDFEFKEPGQAYGLTPYLGMRYVSCLLARKQTSPSMIWLYHAVQHW